MQQDITTRRQRDTAIRLGLTLLLAALLGVPSSATAQDKRSKPSAAVSPVQPVDQAANTPPQPVIPPTPAQRPPQRAQVAFTEGQLSVTADNSSLNQILREISRETGIKITGGVADERVFGKYGPSPASEVINALLDGTGSNMLLVQTDADSPGELILTPRHGGVTPPNPNAPGFEDEAPTDDALPPQAPQEPAPRTPPSAAPAPSSPTPQAAPAPSTANPSADSSTPGSPTDPNAVKTPQDIFQQLQRMRQQQQQQ